MEITIKCEPKEIAALVVGIQERQSTDALAEAIMDKVNRQLEKRGQELQ